MNKKSFSIYIKKSTKFGITPFALKNSFAVTLNNKKVFSLVINAFNLVEKYLLRLDSSIIITAISKMRVKATTSVGILYNITANAKDKLHFINSFSNGIDLLITIKELLKMGAVSIANTTNLSITIKERFHNAINLLNSPISLVISPPQLRKYYYLSDRAASTLGAVSTLTLVEFSYALT